MIISHRYRFIFIKTEKTASTSLADVFAGIVKEKDELLPADQSVRRSLLREHGSLENFSFGGGRDGRRRWFPAWSGLHRHATARDVRAFIGPELFDRYTIITSERNPYDRQVSLFDHRSKKRNESNLASFSQAMRSPVYNLMHYNRLRNWDIYTIGGKVCADHVIRFENLHDDFRDVLVKLGLDHDRYALEHARAGSRRPGTSYREFYDDESKRLVGSWYRREIEHFGYEF